jgi:glycosyltransferase involved in cell wall biosynthesis
MIPFFSVIIPLYNKENFIVEAIHSVLNQSFSDFQVIIVNDGSTDKSLEKVSKILDNRIVIINQENSGAPSARNNGIKAAKSKYIALLDADDYWHSNHLSELKKLIEIYPDAGLYCNNYQVYYTDDVVRPAKFKFNFEKDCLIVDDFFKASVTNCVAWTSGVAFTKEKFNTVGGFDITLNAVEDLDLWVKLALKYQVVFNPTITMSYKIYVGDSLSKREYNDIRYVFISKFSEEEKTNPSLKFYLDVNRCAVALRCKMNDEIELYKKLKSEINYKNLNLKQKLLLSLPKSALKLSKKLHGILVANGFYFSANR